MKLGIIGAGNIGATLAKLFAQVGHEVALGNSRSPETLKNLVRNLNEDVSGHVQAVSAEDAAVFGEVVIEAIPFGHYRDLPKDELVGKTLVSASSYYPRRDGEMNLGKHTYTGLVTAHSPSTAVVKAFNTID